MKWQLLKIQIKATINNIVHNQKLNSNEIIKEI